MKYKGDPRKLTARFTSSCSKCNCAIGRGTTAYYWPRTRTIMCTDCGEPEYKQFLSMAADESACNRTGNPYAY